MADLRRALSDRASELDPLPGGFDLLVRLRRRRHRNQRVRVAVGALAIAGLAVWGLTLAIRTHPVTPQPPPRPAFEPLTPRSAATLRQTWTATVESRQLAPPSATETEVYQASPHRGLLAFPAGCRPAPAACLPAWSGPVPLAATPVPNALAIGDGVVVVATDVLTAFPERCALGGRECRPLWTTEPTPGRQPLSTPTLADGRVFVGASDGTVLAFRATCRTDGGTCAPLWRARTGGSLVSSPPAVADGIVAVVSDRLYVYPESCNSRCRPLWSAAVSALQTAPAAGDGHVFAVESSTLLAFPVSCRSDGGTCPPAWRFTEPSGDFLSTPLVSEQTVYVAAHRLYALAADCATVGQQCRPTWRSTVTTVAMSTPVSGDGIVGVASDRVEVFSSGCPAGQAPCRPLFAGPALTAGVALSRPGISAAGVFVTTQDGRVVGYQVPAR
jgi:outer membrane protein assembly factor BamB